MSGSKRGLSALVGKGIWRGSRPRETLENPVQGSSGTNEIASSAQLDNVDSAELYGLFEFPARAGQAAPPSLAADARCVDIIAVHGLSGSWRTTWSSDKGNDSSIWLRDRLPAVLARINVRPRIRAFGYDSSYVFTSSTADLESCAEDLLTRIRIERQTEEERQSPIIFVAHSLGGLIVKLAINLAHTDDEYHQDILNNTSGCLFLAVPFHGADAASWARLGSQIVSTLSLGMAGNPGLPNALKKNSKDWMKISRDFVQRGKKMTFRSAYETEKMGRNTIVDEASVRNNVPNERVFPVPGSNHRNICKFSDHENGRFGPIGLAITEVVEAALDGHNSKYPIVSELPIATPTFYGRSTQLDELSSALDPSKLGRKGIVLFGIGGSGKTQLALQYVKKKKQLYKAIIWINALTSEQTKQSFADAFHLISKLWPSKDLPNPYVGESKQKLVLSRLRSTLHRNWLLVIDSADDIDNHNLIQLIPDSTHGSIIFTSTRQHAADILSPQGFSSIEIDKLDDQSSKELLLNKAGISNDFQGSDTTRAIVKELNGLPLALEQAGILLQRKVLNLDNFIEEYHANYKVLMDHLPKPGEVQHDKARSMHAILSMLYSYVKKESPTAAAVIQLLAVIGPSQTPMSILLSICQYDFPALNDDFEFQALRGSSKTLTNFRLPLNLLEDVCLVKMRPTSEKSLESVLLHQTICQWITWSPNEGKDKWIMFAALGLGSSLCQGKGSLDWPMGDITPSSYLSRICLTWINHISSLINQFIDRDDLQPPDGLYASAYATVACKFGYIYFCNGRHEEAKTLLSHALEYTVFQTDNNDRASIDSVQLHYCLGVSNYKTGDFGQAKDFIRAAFEQSKRNNGDETAIIYDQLREVLTRDRVIEERYFTAVAATRGHKADYTMQPNSDEHGGEDQQPNPIDHNSSSFTTTNKDVLTHQDYHATHLVQAVISSDEALIQEVLQTCRDQTEIDHALSFAASIGSSHIVKILLDNHANTNAAFKLMITPLHNACYQGHENVVRLLLDSNADIEVKNIDQQTPLHEACSNGHEGVVRLLLDSNADIETKDSNQQTPLHYACFAGHEDAVRLLLDSNADIEAKDRNQHTPLHIACLKRYENVARLLLDSNADVEAKDRNQDAPLHIACFKGYEGFVRLLLDSNANIEAKTIDQQTPLHEACFEGYEGVVRLLLDSNADIEAKAKYQQTPLHSACSRGHKGVVRLLLDSNANIEATTIDQQTPLHTACSKGHENVVQLLLDHGADTMARDNRNYTPLKAAAFYGHETIVYLVEDFVRSRQTSNTDRFRRRVYKILGR